MGTCISKYPESRKLPKFLEPKFLPEYIPQLNSGRVIKVYDGDTITIASKVPNLKHSLIYKFSVRLNGIDSPEIKSNNKDEKTMAIQARDTLSDKILNKDVYLKNIKKEKYGRLLCDVYLEDENINDWMINERYAVIYDGGTKKSPDSWIEYHSHNII